MNVSDLTNLVVGLALIYFGWQQNQIFKRQNEIFATQAGIEMPPPKKSNMAAALQYWPLLAMGLLAVAMWLPQGLVFICRCQRDPPLAS
jgi:hypothetical protein